MKNLNRLLALVLGAGAIAALPSCSEDFLDVDHYDVLSSDYVTSSQSNFDDALLAIYANMNQMINEDIMKPNLWLGCHPTMDTQATGWDKAWMTQSWASDQKELYDEWKRLYSGISFCNDLLDMVEKNKDNKEFDAKYLNQCKAEASAMRGYYYSWLAQNWANVPILRPGENYANLDELPGNDNNWNDVLSEIITDLTFAAENLDWKPANNQYGRATKGMALTYLADAYLWRAYRNGNTKDGGEDVQKAKEILKSIIDSGTYKLQPSFTTLFDPVAWNEESIWEEVVDEGDKSNQWGGYHTNAHGWEFNYAACPDNGGWGTLYLSWEWYTCYEKGDKRRDGSACVDNIANWGNFTDRITGEPLSTSAKSDFCYENNPYMHKVASKQDSYHYNNGGDFAPSVWSLKWWRTGNNTWWSNIFSPVHVYWKRYADVLITYAECCFRTGAEAEGWQYIDQIRDRAFGNLEVGESADKYLEFYKNYAAQESGNSGTYDHFDGYPIPFNTEKVSVPAAKDYYSMVKSKLGFNLDDWQVAVLQERRKEFNAEWTLAPALHRAGLLAEHLAHNYPKDATPISELKDYPWTPRTYDYSEERMDFPIPATELVRNTNLVQNKAYR